MLKNRLQNESKKDIAGTDDFATSHQAYKQNLIDSTSARICVGRTGTRPLTRTWLQFRQDHAIARDSVLSKLSLDFEELARNSHFPIVNSLSESREQYILLPPTGKQVTPETLQKLAAAYPCGQDVQIVISDGLSARAVEHNVPDLLPMLLQGFALENISCGQPVVVQRGRVAVADQIGHALSAAVAINLIGERPGLSSAFSLSAYITYAPGPATISSDRTVVSNIHSQGTPATEAGAYIVQLVKRILDLKVSGVRLQQMG